MGKNYDRKGYDQKYLAEAKGQEKNPYGYDEFESLRSFSTESHQKLRKFMLYFGNSAKVNFSYESIHQLSRLIVVHCKV